MTSLPLLIGSRAAQYHWHDFREPKDYDFIVSEDWLKWFFVNRYSDIKDIVQKYENKYICHYKDHLLELEISDLIPVVGDLCSDGELVLTYRIAQPETLLLLKKSHVTFDIHWGKSISDYHWMLDHGVTLSADEEKICQIRKAETFNRLKLKRLDFNKPNEMFFSDNVEREYNHDSLHEVVKFYERPLFYSLKTNPELAAVDEGKFNSLSGQDKIRAIQEEAMVLALERWVIPGKDTPEEAYKKAVKALCTRLLPEFMQQFAVDYHREIMRL